MGDKKQIDSEYSWDNHPRVQELMEELGAPYCGFTRFFEIIDELDHWKKELKNG